MKVLLLAGEESGVLYARQIRAEVLRRDPSAEVRGYGDYGFEIGDLAVFGIWPVLRRIFYFLRVKRTMERAIDAWRPDVLCTVDYPGMNLKLAAYAKARGVRAVHVVCPQVWAWHQGRIPRIERSLDRLCCFLPFEPALFRPGFATFVGHPLVEEMRKGGYGVASAAAPACPEAARERTLAVLPGSRLGEIDKHLPTLLTAVAEIRRRLPSLRVIVPAANERAYRRILSFVSTSDGFSVTHGGAREALRAADAAVVASGTATFEAAIAGCPFVVVYRVGALLAAILRRVLKGVRHVGLVNVVAEKAGVPCPMPELLQEAFTAARVREQLLPWLTDAAANADARRRLADTMSIMRTGDGAIGRIVDELASEIGSADASARAPGERNGR